MKRSMFWKLIVTVIMLSLITTPAGAGKIDPDLKQILNISKPADKVSVLVLLNERLDTPAMKASLQAAKAARAERHLTVVDELKGIAQSTQSKILRYLRFQKLIGRVESYKAFWIDNIVALKATRRVITRLAIRSDVARIAFNHSIQLIEPVEEAPPPAVAAGIENGIALTRAPQLWALNIDGTGTLACHLDTGVDGNHIALASRWRGRDAGVTPAEAWFDPVSKTTFPFDSGSNGHGTHTMGTILGSAGSNQIGMAPGAKWISAAVIDRGGISQTVADAIAAFQWAADPDGNPGTLDDVPDVVSNSWGLIPYMHGYPPCDPLFNAVIDNLEAAGPVVVFAAGNEGSNGVRTPADRITSPVNTFAVGALNQDGTSIASFSSLGPSRCDNITVKPEVTAVGSNVRSSVPGGKYGILSGTSMACPHVAGAVLLLRQIDPEATADEIKYALYQTAVDLGPTGDDNTFGMGRIDVVAAASALGADFGTFEGHVTNFDTKKPVEGASVRLVETGYYGISDSNGYYRIVALAGTTYDLVASAFGHKAQTVEDVYLPGDSPQTVNFELESTATGTLQGTIVDDRNGDPLENAIISFRNAPIVSVATDANGFYQTLLPGDYDYDIIAQKDDYDSEYASGVYVPEDGVVTQNFELEPDRCFLVTAVRDTDVEPELEEYRKIRKRISERRPFGKKVLHLYREHTVEIAAILLRDPALRDEIRSMISRMAPIVQSIRKGENLDHPALSSEDEAAIYDLLDNLEPWASPRLKAAIQTVRNDIKMLRKMKIGQVRSLLR